MNRSWVRFPQAAQRRPPGSGWAFLYARVVLRCWLWIVAPLVFRVLLVCLGRAALCARGRRPAREIATREPSARSDRSRSPARPCRRPRAPLPGLAHQSLRCPPHRRRLRRCVWWRVVSKPGISTITCRSVKCARGNVCEYVLSRPCRRLSNFARNSRLAVSNVELVSLELQRFREVSKNDRDKLRAKFVWR